MKKLSQKASLTFQSQNYLRKERLRRKLSIRIDQRWMLKKLWKVRCQGKRLKNCQRLTRRIFLKRKVIKMMQRQTKTRALQESSILTSVNVQSDRTIRNIEL